MSYFSINEKCTGCLACVQNCPTGALAFSQQGDTLVILHNIGRCARCLTCMRLCPQQAVEMALMLKGSWEEIIRIKTLRCRVCGEPVFSEVLRGKLPPAPGEFAQDLCPRHRRRRQAAGLRGRQGP
jgi:ferredoxin